eukprot:scaffold14177_cov124-Isochrysis_galbana.AAC.5
MWTSCWLRRQQADDITIFDALMMTVEDQDWDRKKYRLARLRCGRGEVRGVWRRSGRERLAPGLLCRRSVDGSSLLYMWFLVLRPHTMIPLSWRERGIQDPIPSAQKQAHFSLPKHVATRQGRHKGAGKGTYTSCSEGGGPLRGGLPTPLSGA